MPVAVEMAERILCTFSVDMFCEFCNDFPVFLIFLKRKKYTVAIVMKVEFKINYMIFTENFRSLHRI